jgi:hypothetical protein
MIITTTPILEKFEQILAHISQEEKQKLASELAKIVPATSEAEVDWRVGWGYLTTTDEIQVDISMKIAPAVQSNSLDTLQNYFSNLLSTAHQKGLISLEEGLNHILNDTEKPYKIVTLIPTLYLTIEVATLHFSFKASAKENLKYIGEEKRNALKEQLISV